MWSAPFFPQKAVLDGVAKRQSQGSDSHIDYSDIPALARKQLAQFKRAPKKLVAVRLDADVFEWIRKFGPGYSTRINHVLRVVMSQQRYLAHSARYPAASPENRKGTSLTASPGPNGRLPAAPGLRATEIE